MGIIDAGGGSLSLRQELEVTKAARRTSKFMRCGPVAGRNRNVSKD